MHAAAPVDFASWRRQARALLADAVAPQDVSWDAPASPSLFADQTVSETNTPARIPRELARLFESCACHCNPERWALMYRALWRVVHGGERRLLADPADGDVARLRLMAKAVKREVHKMHAFVRFQETVDEEGRPLYAAWFEPQHHILRRAAPFFRDRFASMRWIIATPRGAVRWDGEKLFFLHEPMRKPEGIDDGKEALWRTYYASIFNPARLNSKVMQQHMPRRYWKNLPEAQDIGELARRAAPRVALMQQAQASGPRWAEKVRVEIAPPVEIQACRRCPLWERATQAVEGQGPAPAALMLVGEQPGDEEDLRGLPFVGPAGKVLERALAAAEVQRDAVYVTNAVKHFKWQLRGKRRLHKTPAQRELEACGVWLEQELRQVQPRVVVAMGASAVFALTRQRLPVAAPQGAAASERREAGGDLSSVGDLARARRRRGAVPGAARRPETGGVARSLTAVLRLTEAGLFCEAGNFYIDPWKPVERAVITHAHGDHARPGHVAYLAAAPSEHVLRGRLGAISLQTLAYGERLRLGAVELSLHPAGHVLGSSQVRIAAGGEVWTVSGDYKLEADPTCAPFEPVASDVFVSESTFGLPIYRWKDAATVAREINDWWGANAAAGRASVLFAYAFGKAQRILSLVDPSIGPIVCHGAVEALNRAYRASRVELPPTRTVEQVDKDDLRRALVLAPPSAQSTPWLRRFGDYSDAFASGWMRLRGARRRRAVDRGFVLSDHADWDALTRAIAASGAHRVLLTHGYAAALARWLAERGVQARTLETRFEGEAGAEQ